MPTISKFLGIVISMYFNDHNPPHFHAKYNDFRAEILIETLTLREGQLPPRILGLVLEWAAEHKNELLKNWNSLKETGDFTEIKPLI
ncbi:MAG: DUF4160 domain-containing protein [Prevotellaceae bacterium]|jgi:hypothetical protein|nr:DUF4160 domain-containing protein [Prevotellaceae bacterium]